jgi:UDP-GlcNAc:undecaprenyl-phosphate/decaprenyl-phosphate GlcNAc-1-phosphate transferase
MINAIQHALEILCYIILGSALAVPLLLLNIRLAPVLGLIDWPKARGVTEEQIPIVGHSLVLISVGVLFICVNLYNLSPWMLTTAIVMAVMGHFDDRRPLSALDKIFFQSVCAGTVILLDPTVNQTMVHQYGNWGAFWAFFFIVGLINAINFIDGIDGLAGLVLLMGAAGFMLFSHGLPLFYPYFLYACLLIGMMFPFLYFNVVKRKGFLGNVGSYFFSYLLAMMHLSIPLQSPGPISRLALSGLCFLIPVADCAMVILSRSLTLRSPFQADKGHLHHRLVQTSLPLRYILLNFGVIELAGILAAFEINRSGGGSHFVLPILIFCSYLGVSGILILMAEKASKRRMRQYFQRLDSGQPIYFLKYKISHLNGGQVSHHTLRRLEARVSAEIRITDLCFAEKPDTLFVTLSTAAEPLRGISARLDNIFQAEKVQTTLVIDQGEFVKVSHPAKTPSTSAILRRA